MANLDTILAESNLYNALYGEAGQSENAAANAKALALSATGQTAEAGQYDIASAISTQNAAIAQISGQVQQFQTSRNVLKTVGQQRAGYAASGFADSGTALDVARNSLQQGVLQNQIIGLNASLEAGGYFSQAASSAAEATAARTAAASSTANSTAAQNIAQLSANAAVATKNFMSQIPGFDPNNPLAPTQSYPTADPFNVIKPVSSATSTYNPNPGGNPAMNPATITPENVSSILPTPSFNSQSPIFTPRPTVI